MEYLAITFTIICVFLAGQNNVHTWWTGIVACILYGFVFYDVKLYADVMLQGFFIITGLIGWVLWNQNITQKVLPIRKTDPYKIAIIVFSSVTFAAIYSIILETFTDAANPMLDSFVLTLSISAQILLMQRRLETWYFWIAVNTIAVPLFWIRGLEATSILYAFFWVHAIYASINWNKLYVKQ
jgi:nicotinamide mononucleotide transporter